MNVTGGDTNVSAYFQMRLTAGGDATALTITDFDLSYTRNGAVTAAKADVTDLTAADAAHTDNGGYEVDPTDCPGLHRFDFADAAFAAGVKDVLCTIKHTSCFTETLRVMIDADVNVTKISDDATAADNLELQYDTTGLTGDTFPATQASVSNIANVGSAVAKVASSYVLTTGTQSSGTIASVAALDGTNHEHTDTAGAMDLYYEFLIGSGTPSKVVMTGYLNGNNDDLEVHGYDWVAAGWVQIGTLGGKAAATNEVDSFDLFVDMVGTGADEGKVRVRFTDGAFTLTTATLAIDQIFVSFSQGSEGYDNGAVWLDTNVSNTNTEVGIDGVARNPVSTIAAVNTLLASTNLARIEVAPGSTITFAASQTTQKFIGTVWTLALGGQDLNHSEISGAEVSGIATAANHMDLVNCIVATASVQNLHATGCSFTGTVTETLAGDYRYVNCQSGIAGAGAPTFTKTAGQAITAEYRRWSGSITHSGIQAGDVITIGGELGTVTLNGADGTVEIRGTYKDIVDNRTGTPTLNTDGAIKGVDVATILADTANMQPKFVGVTLLAEWLGLIAGKQTGNATALTEIKATGAGSGTYNPVTDSNEAIRNRILTIPSLVIRENTAQGAGTGNNQIQFDASASAMDGAYDPAVVTLIGGTGIGQTRLIFQYDGGTKTATVDRNWKTNPDATSEFIIIADAGREHVNEGLIRGSTATTATLNTLASSGTNAYNGQLIFIRSGTGDDQARLIIAYNGATKVATVDRAWTTEPDTTSGYAILPTSPVLLSTLTQASIDAIETDTTTDIPALIAALNDLSAAQVNTEVDNALDTAIPELGVAVPTATPTVRTGLMLLYMTLRNKFVTQTSATDAIEVHNDAGMKVTKKLITDDGSDYTEAKMS